MKTDNIISRAIDKYIKRGIEKKIALYPFGEQGIRTKEILNQQYDIEEAIIVDNYLAHKYPGIISLDEVADYEAYIWILTCANPEFHNEILSTIKCLVPDDQIIDVFERSSPVYSEKYRILSKLGTEEGRSVSTPCWEFLDLIKKKKSEYRTITVAEIGVGWGATTVEACKLLHKDDMYFCFDYEDIISDLLYDLKQVPEICCQVVGKGNSHMVCDSYTWNLSKLLFEMRNNKKNGIFDIVYLDGSHTFLHDGLACCILKELLTPNGYIIFDDMYWFCKGEEEDDEPYSEMKEFYTDEQLSDCQIQRVVNAFMIEDKSFQEVYMVQSLNPYRAVYKKID